MAETSLSRTDINFWCYVVTVSFWTFVVCQEETSENLEGIIPGGLINCGKKNLLKRFDSLSRHGRQGFLEPDK